jgi:hypothetical protein
VKIDSIHDELPSNIFLSSLNNTAAKGVAHHQNIQSWCRREGSATHESERDVVGIGGGSGGTGKGGGVAPHERNWKATPPNATRWPVTNCASLIRTSLTVVPLVEPKSRTLKPPSGVNRIAACRLDTESSRTTNAHSSARPTIVSAHSNGKPRRYQS